MALTERLSIAIFTTSTNQANLTSSQLVQKLHRFKKKAKKSRGVTVEIVTSRRGDRISASDIAKFDAQHGGLTVRKSGNFHDRFLIIDDKALYVFGASLKDLGARCFAFTKLDASEIPMLKARMQ